MNLMEQVSALQSKGYSVIVQEQSGETATIRYFNENEDKTEIVKVD